MKVLTNTIMALPLFVHLRLMCMYAQCTRQYAHMHTYETARESTKVPLWAKHLFTWISKVQFMQIFGATPFGKY